jgi:hypothetical protein
MKDFAQIVVDFEMEIQNEAVEWKQLCSRKVQI